MREIKFRALSRATGKFVFGLPQYTSGGDIGIISGWFGDDGFEQYESIEVLPESVSQFTGVKDNNKVDVFEGDIIGPVMDCSEGNNCEVVFYDGCFCAKYKDNYRPLTKTSIAAWIEINDTAHYDFTVKGNIHENPELLNA